MAKRHRQDRIIVVRLGSWEGRFPHGPFSRRLSYHDGLALAKVKLNVGSAVRFSALWMGLRRRRWKRGWSCALVVLLSYQLKLSAW